MQIEWQIVKKWIRLFLEDQSDLVYNVCQDLSVGKLRIINQSEKSSIGTALANQNQASDVCEA